MNEKLYQIGCGYCYWENVCQDREPKINKAKQGCKGFEHHLMYDDEYYESQPYECCPKCGRNYDDIDFDFQSCSKCGWDAEKESFDNEIVREPADEDFMNGDADLLSGEWF